MKRGRGRARKGSPSPDESSSTISGRGHGKQLRSEITYGEPSGIPQTFPLKHNSIPQLIRRPEHGKIGYPIKLLANFKLLNVPLLHIYCYHVKILKYNNILVENRNICREVFWEIVAKNQEIFGMGYFLVYDDCHILYSLNKLKIEQPESELHLWPEERANFKPTHASYLVQISFTDYFMIAINEESLDFQRSMQFLDCLVTQRERCPYMRMASSFFAFQQYMFLKPYTGIPWEVPSMGPGMEAWNGLHGAVKRCEKGLMLNVDVCTKVFYKIDMWLMDFYLAVLNEFVSRRQPYSIETVKTFTMNANQRQRLKDALQGLMLKLTYDSRHVKFLDVGQPANIQRFELKRGEDSLGQVTVEEYFHRYKNINLQFPSLPVLHCGKTTRTEYFPMELLRLSDKVQRVKKRLTPYQITKLIRGTALSPLQRFKRIDWFLENMRISSEDEFIQQFGVHFPSINNKGVPESVKVNGRILPPPIIRFRSLELPVKDGYWHLNDNFFQTPSNVLFGVVCVNQAININDFWEPFNNLVRACEHFGMKFASEHFRTNDGLYSWDTRKEVIDDHLLSFQKLCNRTGKKNLKPLLIFIVPEKDDEIYGRIKVACDKEAGIACQVILAKTFLSMHGRSTVSHNISLKINAKLDGINNEVSRENKYQIFWQKFTDHEAPTLFLGIDVTHPPSGDTSSPSIAAVVGSLNVSATRYAASIAIQLPKQEIVKYVVDAFRARIIEFSMQAGCKPKHIVLFRDGVSDSQFLDIMNEELLFLKTAAYNLDQSYDPTISYVVVQKRHHTRFIAEDSIKRGKEENIPPGTVVDNTITSPSHFDFYLCSHRGAIGTSRPSHYIVLFDSWHLSSDEWQQMTYALCHVYVRCNKSVSIPAPVYYAHLACDRAKRILKYGRMGEAARRREPSVHALEESFTINPDTPSMYFV